MSTPSSPADATAPPPRVFLSCAHVSVEHAEVVCDVWVFRRSHGIDATVDRAAAHQRRDSALWMVSYVGAGVGHHATPFPYRHPLAQDGFQPDDSFQDSKSA